MGWSRGLGIVPGSTSLSTRTTPIGYWVTVKEHATDDIEMVVPMNTLLEQSNLRYSSKNSNAV